jgi:hypothetical protein
MEETALGVLVSGLIGWRAEEHIQIIVFRIVFSVLDYQFVCRVHMLSVELLRLGQVVG